MTAGTVPAATFGDAAALRALFGADPLVSEWLTVDQASVDRFARGHGRPSMDSCRPRTGEA